MRERDIHSIIEEQNPEEKNALYEELKTRLNLPETQTQVMPKKMKKSWVVSLATACVLIVCLAVVLPIVLTDDSNPARYRQSGDYTEVMLDCTLKEYAEQNKKQILYLDWYDIADDVQTYKFVNKDDSNDVIFLQETISNGETGDLIYIYITDINTRVEDFEYFHGVCTNEYTFNKVEVYWCIEEKTNLAMFEYKQYRYYIEIDMLNQEDLIKEIVENMLG